MEVAAFNGAYLLVITIEPLVDLAILGAAKAFHVLKGSALVEARLYQSG